MLPNFSRLSLEPTGLFYTLPQPEADALNADGGQDPITLDKYKAGQHRDSDEATFSVRNETPNDDGTYGYRVYVAEGLWGWVSRGLQYAKLPETRQPIWREDWWELSDRYAPGVPYPQWVRNLPLSDPGVPDTKTYATTPAPAPSFMDRYYAIMRNPNLTSTQRVMRIQELRREMHQDGRRLNRILSASAPPARLPRPQQPQYPSPSAVARQRQLRRQDEQLAERRRQREAYRARMVVVVAQREQPQPPQ